MVFKVSELVRVFFLSVFLSMPNFLNMSSLPWIYNQSGGTYVLPTYLTTCNKHPFKKANDGSFIFAFHYLHTS